jgi:hypothetical protein
MNDRTIRAVGAGAIAGTGAIHLALAPEYFGEQAYVGFLFLLGAVACAIIAWRLRRADDPAAWAAGSMVSAGMALGFVLSRTTGLPGFHEGEWELSGLVSLLLEGAFVVLALAALRNAFSRRASTELAREGA